MRVATIMTNKCIRARGHVEMDDTMYQMNEL